MRALFRQRKVEEIDLKPTELFSNFLEQEQYMSPAEIKKFLDWHVIGQDHAKKSLAVAVANRCIRKLAKDPVVLEKHGGHDITLEKSNVLLIGPTGTGKTLLVQKLQELLECPMVVADATSFTGSGYVGGDTLSILGSVLDQAYSIAYEKYARDNSLITMDEMWAKTLDIFSYAIVYIDEIDKIHNVPGATGEPVNTSRVQDELLKMIEGSPVSVHAGLSSVLGSTFFTQHKGYEYFNTLPTENILFIVGGSFHGIEDIIADRLKTSSIGFQANTSVLVPTYDTLLEDVTTEDLISFGMKAELMGRLHHKTILQSLTSEDLIRILTEPESSIVKQYTHVFKLYGFDLNITSEALKKIANQAIKLGTGARSLRSILDASLLDLQYLAASGELSKKKITVDESMIKVQ